jgi:hypothetical protein
MLNWLIGLGIVNELFYVFYLVLVGKRKWDVRRIMESMNFGEEVILKYFDLLWNDEIQTLVEDEIAQGNLDNFEVSDVSASLITCRTQYLRIILYYSDSDYEGKFFWWLTSKARREVG